MHTAQYPSKVHRRHALARDQEWVCVKFQPDMLACCKHCCRTDNVLSEDVDSMSMLYLQIALPGFIE